MTNTSKELIAIRHLRVAIAELELRILIVNLENNPDTTATEKCYVSTKREYIKMHNKLAIKCQLPCL